jgi:hypothetical protein
LVGEKRQICGKNIAYGRAQHGTAYINDVHLVFEERYLKNETPYKENPHNVK